MESSSLFFLESIKINPKNILNKKECLIEGGQGEIYEGYLNNKRVIIKKFKNVMGSEQREIDAYLKLKHESMVEFYGFFIDESDGNLNLVLEYADGENLSDLIEDVKLNYDHKLQIIEKIASLLQYLRLNHTVHRDLKPDNIMGNIIDDKNISLKVLDFGICKVASKTVFSLRTSSGTLLYSPPELMQIGVRTSFKYDIWSYGLIVSYLFSGEIPWAKKNQLQLELCLVKKTPFPIPKSIDDENIVKLIELCTRVDPNDRINPETILYLIDLIKKGERIADIKLLDEKYYK